MNNDDKKALVKAREELVKDRVDAWVDNFDPDNVDPNNPMHPAIGRFWSDFNIKYGKNSDREALARDAQESLKIALAEKMSPGVEAGGNFKEIQEKFDGSSSEGDQKVGMLKWLLDTFKGMVGGIGSIVMSAASALLSFSPAASEWVSGLLDSRKDNIKDAEKAAAGVATLGQSITVKGVPLRFTAEDRKLTADYFASEFMGTSLPPQEKGVKSPPAPSAAPAAQPAKNVMDQELFDALNELDGEKDTNVDLASIAKGDSTLTLEELGLKGEDKKVLLDKFKEFAAANDIVFDKDKNEFTAAANSSLPTNVTAAPGRS